MSAQTYPDHQPTYLVARGRGWVECCCGWTSNKKISGNQMWAQLQYGKHLLQVRA